MLETGDWSARVRVARRLLAQSWLPLPWPSLPPGWLAFRTPALPPLHLPRPRWPGRSAPQEVTSTPVSTTSG